MLESVLDWPGPGASVTDLLGPGLPLGLGRQEFQAEEMFVEPVKLALTDWCVTCDFEQSIKT